MSGTAKHRIAVFYPQNTTCAWSCSTGVALELERQGHDVVRAPLLLSERDPGTPPGLEVIEKCDKVLLLGHEHYAKLLDARYSLTRWQKLRAEKAAWYSESAFRDDGVKISAEHLKWADTHWFPAVQDAEFFDQAQFALGRTRWLPFGVDTNVFYPRPEKKKYGLAFIGATYPKRMSFLSGFARCLTDGQMLLVGRVNVEDLGGPLLAEQAELYAKNIRQIKLFMNLPSLSRLLVTKVLEVMACGTCLLTPTLTGEATGNMKLFKNHVHLEYYSERNPDHLARLARELDAEDARREAIAAAGAEEVHAKHSLEGRLREIIGERAGDLAAVPAPVSEGACA